MRNKPSISFWIRSAGKSVFAKHTPTPRPLSFLGEKKIASARGKSVESRGDLPIYVDAISDFRR